MNEHDSAGNTRAGEGVGGGGRKDGVMGEGEQGGGGGGVKEVTSAITPV